MNKTSFNFESLNVYQKAVLLSRDIYKLTQKWPREFLFGLTDQLRRAILSISLNIAEGSSRSNKDFLHFLSIARGSCYECIPLIQIALQLNLLTKDEYSVYYSRLKEIAQMLSGLRTSLR